MISQRIRALRAEQKISQKELARQLFISPQAISKWERNEATPNPEAISRMAEIFGVSTDYLLGRTEKKQPAPEDRGGSDEKDARIANWFRALPRETRQAILTIAGGPKDLGE